MLCYRLALYLAFLPILLGCGAKKPASAESANKLTPTEDVKKPIPVDPAKEVDEVAISCLYIDRCLDRLKAEPESELLGERVASIVVSAERTLPVIWGTDPKTLPAPLRDKIDGYPAKIREWVDRINELKSQQALKAVTVISDQHSDWRKANTNMRWQDWIERDEVVIRQIQNLVAGMSAGPALDKAAEILLKNQQRLNVDSRGQLTDYQKKAVRHSYRFVSFVLTNTVIRDSVLLEEFENAEVAKIDAGLLGADARRIYDTAISMMEDKLKARNRADFLNQLSETEKWSLHSH